MGNVRCGVDVMNFGDEEQEKLLLFMKISLFMDIGIRVRGSGAVIID